MAEITMKDKLNAVYQMFTNNGQAENKDAVQDMKISEKQAVATDPTSRTLVTMRDLVTSETATRFIPQVVQRVIRDVIEPELLVSGQLFENITLNAGTRIEIGAVGAMVAADIPEGQEYPEKHIAMDGGDMIAVTVKKSGCMIRVTDEVINDSQWDVFGLWLKAAGAALARHKEAKAVKLLNWMGTTVFDNNVQAGSSPTGINSMMGSTTGRDINGDANGTLSNRDFFDLVAYLYLNGYMANTLLLHPFSWALFAQDPIMNEIVLRNGTIKGLPTGGPSKGWGTSHNGLGLTTHGQSPLSATYQTNPSSTPSPLNIIITPYVPFTPPTTVGGAGGEARCSILLCDRSNTGIIVTKENVSIEEFDDPARDIKAMKCKERYGFAMREQGKAVSVAKNVVIAPQFAFNNVNSQSLQPIDQSQSI